MPGLMDKVGFAPVNPNRGLLSERQRAPLVTAAQAQQVSQPTPSNPIQALFNQYMSGIFNQKYAPPMLQGGPLQSYGSYFGFGGPKMNPIQAAPVPQAPAVNRAIQGTPDDPSYYQNNWAQWRP